MNLGQYIQAVGKALDPRRDIEDEIPRAFLLAKYSVEYLFKIAGFFLLLCIASGLALATCSDNRFILFAPIFLAVAFFFYIALTTLGIPIFLAIGAVRNSLARQVLAYLTVAAMMIATFYSLAASPLMLVLEQYVADVFPSARECLDKIELPKGALEGALSE